MLNRCLPLLGGNQNERQAGRSWNGSIIRVRSFLIPSPHRTFMGVTRLSLQQKLLFLPCLRSHNILCVNTRHFGGETLQAFTLDILILKVVSSLDLGHESLRFLFRNLHHQHIVTEPNLKIRPVLLSVLPR